MNKRKDQQTEKKVTEEEKQKRALECICHCHTPEHSSTEYASLAVIAQAMTGITREKLISLLATA